MNIDPLLSLASFGVGRRGWWTGRRSRRSRGRTFYSLQLGPAAAQLADDARVQDLSSTLTDWSATAATLSQLDLLISFDSAVGNLAGGLGRPVWVCLAARPDWRWMRERSDSPWFPTARLFRQRRGGEWGPVFEEVVQALEQLVQSTSGIAETRRLA